MADENAKDVTPLPLHGPSQKEKKYDRQLRLWAASGQYALEEAHVLLVNTGSGVVGVEALKNLVLPGIGQFSILDSAVVTEADLGINFFLEDEDVGKFRAERTCRLLEELNPDVKGHAITEPLESFITRPQSLNPFTLLLITLPIDPAIHQKIVDHATATSIPAFYIHSIGFYSHFSPQLPHVFPVVDTHPDPATTTDLRLLEPWPELTTFALEKTQNMDSLDEEEHGHLPYLVLLLHYLEIWKTAHEGKPPVAYREKSEFRDMVRRGARTNNAEGGEENFDEAVGAVLKTVNPHAPSSAVKEVFDARECDELEPDTPNFWFIAHAVRSFYQTHAVLPLAGGLPDMKARSADYIRLQNIYKHKAQSDVLEVRKAVLDLEIKHSRSTRVGTKEIKAFCKSAGYIKLIRGREPHVVIPGESVKWGERAKSAVIQLTDPISLIPLYIAFLAYDSYAASHVMDAQISDNHAPESSPDKDPDVQAAKITGIAYTMLDDLIKQAGTFVEDPEYSEVKRLVENCVAEFVRAQGGELHNVSAATGGMVAQEVIKVITKQYVPVDNVCLFDGIGSRTGVFKI